MADLTDLVKPPDWHNSSRPTPSTPESVTRSTSVESMRQNIVDTVSKGTLSPNRFEIFISGLDPDTHSDRFNMSCESVSFPGRSMSTQPARVYGPIREMPYERLYTGDLDVTFRIGNDMLERNFFEDWMDTVASKNSSDFKYHGIHESGYAKSIKINQLDQKNNVVYSIIVREAFPKAVNTIALDHGKTDEYHKQMISFAFRDYEVVWAKWKDSYTNKSIEVTEGDPIYQRIGGHTTSTGSGGLMPVPQQTEKPREPHNGYERLW